MVRSRLFKSAFTMIELIFAMVIIAISVISLPMMTQATSRGMESSLAQEAIFAASAQLNQVLSYKWDMNSQETPGELSKVIHTGIPSDCNTSDGVQRPGHVHRLCLNVNTTIPLIATGGDGNNSLGSMQVNGADVFEGGAASQSGYKELYTMDIDVAFSTFGGSANNNMKEVKITVKKDGDDYVVLRTYSANIGEAEAAKRMF
ncbi:MAG: type II secretion system GspH family protein [Sulfurimonas sp.]|nr:type II secretion system GspH family protein [Sulfurimonas sp.]